MTSGAVVAVVVCTPNGGTSVAPCSDIGGLGQGPVMQQAYLLDQYQGAFYEQATAAFDSSVGANFFGVGFVGVLAMFLIGKGFRAVMKPLGIMP